jgi:hypothetical protein
MLISKLKSATIGVLMLGALGIGGGLAVQPTGWAEQPNLHGEKLTQREQNSSHAQQARGTADSPDKARLDARYKKLAVDINGSFPDETHVALALRGDKLVVSGYARDIGDAREILRIVRWNAPQVDHDAKRAGTFAEDVDFPPGPNGQLNAGPYVVNELIGEPWTRPARNLTLEEAIAFALKNGAVAARHLEAGALEAEADNLTQQRAIFKRQMHNLRLNVEVAYWNLYEAYGTLKSCEDTLRALHKTWIENYYRAKEGKVDSAILQQIRGQYEEFRGERTNSLKAVLEAERNLRGIMGLPVDYGNRLVPVTAPSLARVELQWEELFDDAMKNRPELTLARDNLRQREMALTREKNSLESNPASLKTQASLQTHRLKVAQAHYVLKDQEDRIKRSLTQQYQATNKWYRLIEDRRNERRAYADALTKKFKQVETGKKSVDLDLLDVQRRQQLAATKEFQAIAEYNNSLARLQFARGTIMRDDNPIFLKDAAPVRTVGYEEQTSKTPLVQPPPAATNVVHLKTAHFEADCKSLASAGSPERIILLGDVHLICTKNGQTIRIEGQRVVLNLMDGTYTVDSALAGEPVPVRGSPLAPARDGQ